MKAVRLVVYTLILGAAATGHTMVNGLEKIGSGEVHYLGIFKVYNAELFAKKPLEEKNILSEDISKCLVLHYTRKLSAEDIIKAANTILRRQHDTATVERQRQETEALHKNYVDVKDGDSYMLCYKAAEGLTELFYNDAEVITIQSREFGQFYLGIWLGDKDPISDDLRRSLLQQ
ncbi:MAG: chalcone isomerase family protein [Desulfopila sp.]